jgi:prepilin-type N-terminal cleavage/methylation domain-containing protein
LTGATESMQHVNTPSRRPIACPRGFTLIELMVGLVLGILVCFAVVTLFVNNSRARREIDQASQQIENGRYALDLLRDDLHLAGYYGDLVPQQGFTVSTGVVPNRVRHRRGGTESRRATRRSAMAGGCVRDRSR